MTKLPTDLSGQELVRILTRIGFVIQRQRGSHLILRRESPFARVSVPDHKALRVGHFAPFFAKPVSRLNSWSSSDKYFDFLDYYSA
jgi:predicted RNA binding protein YcfA (HicA-like mRNA interferase family)